MLCNNKISACIYLRCSACILFLLSFTHSLSLTLSIFLSLSLSPSLSPTLSLSLSLSRRGSVRRRFRVDTRAAAASDLVEKRRTADRSLHSCLAAVRLRALSIGPQTTCGGRTHRDDGLPGFIHRRCRYGHRLR